MDYKNRFPVLFTILSLIILTLSFIFTRDRFTWVLEVAPILIALPLLVFTYKFFQFSKIIYILLIIHFVILAVGGIYTYAEVPLGYWMQDLFGFERNHYDRIGHFFQGFVPALVLREILLRTSPIRPGKWLFTIIIWMCLGFSAFYELIEWWTASSQGASADAFLGSQGDIWDAQKDMLLAFIGATTALLSLSRIHDRSMAANDNRK
ncbi:DUF2238 domain-containing protein [Myxococcota bacterium]|nr:DUF2238 domain-containing protein [Myxococcota bacterium]MBU1379564.1 DUF2238 domain-containing protein [Myxococcota bacterium]MBU1495282.1 DUF2238 domain-containing protein [Myxococcota bacterium]